MSSINSEDKRGLINPQLRTRASGNWDVNAPKFFPKTECKTLITPSETLMTPSFFSLFPDNLIPKTNAQSPKSTQKQSVELPESQWTPLVVPRAMPHPRKLFNNLENSLNSK